VRDGTVIYDTTVESLRASTTTSARSTPGFECGSCSANFQDVHEGVPETYETRRVERELSSQRPGSGRDRRLGAELRGR
jgi:hypothetical protein